MEPNKTNGLLASMAGEDRSSAFVAWPPILNEDNHESIHLIVGLIRWSAGSCSLWRGSVTNSYSNNVTNAHLCANVDAHSHV